MSAGAGSGGGHSDTGALRIAAIRLFCRNVEAAARFYVAAFGCRQIAQDAPFVTLVLGGQRIELWAAQLGNGAATAQSLRDSAPARARVADTSIGQTAPSNSTAFQHCAIIVSNMAAAMTRLSRCAGWSAISTAGPQMLPAASGGVTAFKFRDPDGHPLEFLEFPVGDVPEPWRALCGKSGSDSPCLGIDHSAITVVDTERSLAFYAALGFTMIARQINRGPEQARMDAVAAAVVEVTGLMPPGGAPPHLELLCYRSPPVVAASVQDGHTLATTLLFNRDDATPSTDDGALRDPDGHRLLIR